MKILIEQKTLAATLKRVTAVVENRATIPILAHVAIRAADSGAVTFTATDLDIELTATISAQVQTSGACTIAAKTLSDIAAKLPAGSLVQIDYDAAKETATVSAGRSRFSLSTLPITDYPQLASGKFQSEFQTTGATIAHLFSGLFAASTEETRYYLQGVYLHPRDGATYGVTTDGHRLAEVMHPVAHEFTPVIVPRKTASEAARSFADGDVTVSVSETKIRFTSPSFSLLSKVIDGTFPDYRRIIPSNHAGTVTFDAADMRTVIDRVSAASSERASAVTLDIASDEITASITSPANSALDVVACDARGPELRIGFNSGYLGEILRHTSGAVSVQYSSAGDPVIIRAATATVGDDGASVATSALGSALYVLMPMRVN